MEQNAWICGGSLESTSFNLKINNFFCSPHIKSFYFPVNRNVSQHGSVLFLHIKLNTFLELIMAVRDINLMKLQFLISVMLSRYKQVELVQGWPSCLVQQRKQKKIRDAYGVFICYKIHLYLTMITSETITGVREIQTHCNNNDAVNRRKELEGQSVSVTKPSFRTRFSRSESVGF